MLAAQGVELTEQKVYDVWRGRYTDARLLRQVRHARAKVASRHARTLRQLQAFKTVLFLVFWLI